MQLRLRHKKPESNYLYVLAHINAILILKLWGIDISMLL